jgi:hypothetical protein
MSLSLQPVRVSTGSADEEGCLVFGDGRLVAVLVRLSEQHGEDEGAWYFETGFGRLDGIEHPTFPDLETAQDWVAERMRSVTSGASPP